MATDPAKLKPRHRQFAELVATGITAGRAYEQAGFKTSGRSADTCAARLLAKAEISSYVDALRWEAAETAKAETILSIQEKRAYLANVVRTAPGDIGEDSPLCQAFKYTDVIRSIRMPDKLKAIELDAKLAGELKDSNDVNVQTTVTVVLSAEQQKAIQARKAAAMGVHGRN